MQLLKTIVTWVVLLTLVLLLTYSVVGVVEVSSIHSDFVKEVSTDVRR